MTKSPAYKFRLGLITATIGDNDRFYSVDMTRSYKGNGGHWQSTSSYSHADLLNVAKCAERSETWIARRGKPMQPNNTPDQNPIQPQNLSCPAGGPNSHQPQPNETSNGQRGVIVAPPSGNTDGQENDKMQVLHMGFDTLAIAIQANIPPDLFDYLEVEKERADKEHQDVLIELNGIKLHLKSHGGNGYRFIARGGPDGAFVSRSAHTLWLSTGLPLPAFIWTTFANNLAFGSVTKTLAIPM